MDRFSSSFFFAVTGIQRWRPLHRIMRSSFHGFLRENLCLKADLVKHSDYQNQMSVFTTKIYDLDLCLSPDSPSDLTVPNGESNFLFSNFQASYYLI